MLSVKALIITYNTTITCLCRDTIPVTAAALLRCTTHNSQWEVTGAMNAHTSTNLCFTDKTFGQISPLGMRLGVAADKARAQEWTETFKCTVTWEASWLVTYRLTVSTGKTYFSRCSRFPPLFAAAERNGIVFNRHIHKKKNQDFSERTSTVPLSPDRTFLGRSAKRLRAPPRHCGVKLLLPTDTQRGEDGRVLYHGRGL